MRNYDNDYDCRSSRQSYSDILITKQRDIIHVTITNIYVRL